MQVEPVRIEEAGSVPVAGVFRRVSEAGSGAYMRLDVTRVRRGELSIEGHIRAVCLETGVIVVFDADMRVVVYPRARVELGAPARPTTIDALEWEPA
jgi:hypothetical protein